MYTAKESHAGAEVYASEHDPYSRDRLTLMGELRHALDKGELVMHYQPKIDLATGGVRGVEALVRWDHPVHGLLGPDQFLPAAEHTGLMRPLTAYVLERAAAQCNAWRGEGYGLVIAVNLSVRNLHDLHLPEEIGSMLKRWSLPAAAFQLEITESAIMGDPVRAMGVAADLRDLGVGLSIDDFGTGFSSLSYLKQFPVHEIKIDKSFVLGMDENDDDNAIVRSTIFLAHSLGLDVVAEGVETSLVRDRLEQFGCDFAQGHLLCRPITGAALTVWLRSCGRPVAPATAIFGDVRPLART
jgi:EAL domain-containing protein (putative c-di-GMP-specific phosphodiesterase class I)